MIGPFHSYGTASAQYMPDALVYAVETRAKRQSVLLSGDDPSGEIAALLLGGVSLTKRLASALPLDEAADRRFDSLYATLPRGPVRRIPTRK